MNQGHILLVLEQKGNVYIILLCDVSVKEYITKQRIICPLKFLHCPRGSENVRFMTFSGIFGLG
jgi:hypothetical protein